MTKVIIKLIYHTESVQTVGTSRARGRPGWATLLPKAVARVGGATYLRSDRALVSLGSNDARIARVAREAIGARKASQTGLAARALLRRRRRNPISDTVSLRCLFILQHQYQLFNMARISLDFSVCIRAELLVVNTDNARDDYHSTMSCISFSPRLCMHSVTLSSHSLTYISTHRNALN